jgi:hypothetical protein
MNDDMGKGFLLGVVLGVVVTAWIACPRRPVTTPRASWFGQPTAYDAAKMATALVELERRTAAVEQWVSDRTTKDTHVELDTTVEPATLWWNEQRKCFMITNTDGSTRVSRCQP